ncbi:Putative transcription regulator protein [Liberibacter crescens BT-1]|uniref:Putative transcription regulator protein n=1 Tax=Liberibacter crescens (strain BT-1) TaxID=1215343 RepID=L0EWU9_LIBCB|nr:BolA family protein [Liberibacter crescens]AGA65123.1 Putative transcription regulator protein [Liberibacter crescens BT-1]AMC13095.1 transcriptional regulator [Liberibacter crescens]
MLGKNISLKSRIEAKLSDAFLPKILEVTDQSKLHIGHQKGFDGSKETHLHIHIVSEEFTGMKRLLRHQLIYRLLQEELKNELHAIIIEAFSPNEKIHN